MLNHKHIICDVLEQKLHMSDSIWVEEAESSRRANCQSKMSISGHKADFKGFCEPSDLINRAMFSKITSALIRQTKFRDGGHMEEHHRIKSGTWMSHWGLHPASTCSRRCWCFCCSPEFRKRQVLAPDTNVWLYTHEGQVANPTMEPHSCFYS